jgi:hypothetical protein
MENFMGKSKNSGIAWNLKLSVRIHGPYKKPVITGDWLQFSRKKGLAVGDRIVQSREVDGENGNTRLKSEIVRVRVCIHAH